jgi:hypothetical protein
MTNVIQFPKVDLRIPPEFVEPTNLARMSEQEQYKLLEDIRTRRMVAVTQHLTLQAERKKVKDAELQRRYDRAIKLISSCVVRIDNDLSKIEEYLHKLRGTRLEAMEDAEGEDTGSEIEDSGVAASMGYSNSLGTP